MSIMSFVVIAEVCLYTLFFIFRVTTAQEVYGTESFSDVRETSSFVDKTLLIQHIFNYTNLVITAPRYFGKSVNIDMIRTFLRNDEDDNDSKKIFHGTEIMSNEKFVKDHMNNHPVLYCNFDIQFDVLCADSLLSYYRQIIFGIFIEHDYLNYSPALGDEQRKEYAKYIEENDELDEAKLAEALRFLSQILHKHHDKRVIVLIDEYDAVVVSNLLIDDGYNDTTDLMRFHYNILNRLLLDNKHIERTVLSGTLPMKFTNVEFKQIKFTQNENFLKFYGFTDDEVHVLVDKFNLTQDERKDVQKWYDGYYSLKSSTCIFCPLSISKFLKSKRTYSFWVRSFSLKDIVLSLMDHYQFQVTIVRLVQAAEPVVIKMKPVLTVNDFIVLKKGFNKDWSNNLDSDIFLQFLLEVGYLTYGESVIPLQESAVVVKVPNREIRESLSVTIKQYFSEMRAS